MNASSEYGQRPRAPANGPHPSAGARGVPDSRNGMTQANHSGTDGHVPPGAQPSRAEKFEDEKKRIIESCFVKKEVDGSRMY